MTKAEKRIIKKKSPLPLLLGGLAALAVVLLLLWKFVFTPPPPPVQEPAGNQAAGSPPHLPATTAEKPTAATAPAPAPATATPATTVSPPEKRRPDACQQTAAAIKEYFSWLDRQDYLVNRHLKEDSHSYFGRLVDKLLANPPVIVGETNSLFAILGNTAHFYRVLKKDNLLLAKDVLDHEGSRLENDFRLFYRWSQIAPQCPASGIKIHLPLPGLYEYACFFLNTLGGRSYLFRRPAPVRLLVRYYSILILDRANDQSLNKYGLDIRPAIDSLITDLGNDQALTGRDQYLASLIELQGKYQHQYGDNQAR